MIAIIIIATIVLWLLFALVLPTNLGDDNASALLFEKSFPFVFASLHLSTLAAQYGFSIISDAFQGGEVIKKAMLLGGAVVVKAAVIALAIGIVLIIIVEVLIRKRIGYFIRDILTLAFCFALGYTIMRIVVILGSLGFPLSLLFVFLPIVRALLVICFAFSILLWFLPNGVIAAMNRDREARERAAMRAKPRASNDEDLFAPVSAYAPVYVTDDDGNQYPVEIRGDYLVIRGNYGEISTRWEYVKGQPFFDLNGTRFFPH